MKLLLMFIKFKIYNRPITPHLLIYTPQLSSLFSIWHRISGLGLTVFLTVFLIFIKIILSLNFTVNWLILLPLEISQWIPIYFSLLTLVLLIYHSFNGMRHIIWDLGFFLNTKYLYKFSFLLFFLIFLTLINYW
uniref:Succinate:cytochrome c oxidoreductase subunit 3 n=1 Tax=Sarcopeltis skottsbergii TaxID=2765380 RepID=A0A7M1VHS3_SARSK|nr:succinate:cytochrome c oxidoreductase subunit 3 [Sarcopeltis skottsbergii]QOS04466.1 succinate:cytochrome c oxidoreductase subunit 3 [Sarcopeltis skottsbergii]